MTGPTEKTWKSKSRPNATEKAASNDLFFNVN